MRLRGVAGLLLAPLILLLLSACSAQGGPASGKGDLILATTTSTQDSGLLDVLVPLFEKRTGYRVKTIAVGSGAALSLGERGEADVLLVHSPAAEKRLIQSGAATDRKLVMHNDFVLVGPPSDPAGIRGVGSAAAALRKIAGVGLPFLSRGDQSGTHAKELSLWAAAGVKPGGAWYQESGSGMGQTLNIASEKSGYSLTDRATYLALRKNLALEVLLEGDGPLLNPYHVMQVNVQRFAKVNADGARTFAQFLLSAEGQAAIGAFGVEKYGVPLFFPDGGKSEEELTSGK